MAEFREYTKIESVPSMFGMDRRYEVVRFYVSTIARLSNRRLSEDEEMVMTELVLRWPSHEFDDLKKKSIVDSISSVHDTDMDIHRLKKTLYRLIQRKLVVQGREDEYIPIKEFVPKFVGDSIVMFITIK